MIQSNPTWQVVREKQEELKRLVDENWRNGEYHIAAIGERTLRTVNGSLASSENAIAVTNNFLESISKLQHFIRVNSGIEE
ncbi:MAG: hypothetical protein JW712_02855 [Dehalococcoidales bacterium]|nr:hypothetical protein [Dehalococcoidales bacterium]